MTTLKQETAVKDLLENVGKPIGQAMLDAGYSPATAKNPDHLTESKGWNELMDKYLPDDKLLSTHDEALVANRVISAINTNKEATGGTTDFIEVPDHAIRLKAVELGYRVKGRLSNNVQVLNQGEMSIEFIK